MADQIYGDESQEVKDLVQDMMVTTKGEFSSGQRFPFKHDHYKSKSKKRVIELFKNAGVDIEFVSDKDDNQFVRITEHKKAP